MQTKLFINSLFLAWNSICNFIIIIIIIIILYYNVNKCNKWTASCHTGKYFNFHNFHKFKLFMYFNFTRPGFELATSSIAVLHLEPYAAPVAPPPPVVFATPPPPTKMRLRAAAAAAAAFGAGAPLLRFPIRYRSVEKIYTLHTISDT